jgi:hypothetical protein
MSEVHVAFKIVGHKLLASLSIDGVEVTEATTVPKLAHGLRLAKFSSVTLTDGFSFPLPADSTVLAAAAARELAQPFATFYLIAECSWVKHEL